jgi:hypothetical protein
MIFLALLCFSASWNTFALPTDLQLPDIPPKHHLRSVFTHEDNRSLYGILWSCLSTIFACTWIAVHPNIPAPRDSSWEILGRRLAIMGYILLAPEFVIFWAARQHYGACYLTKKYEERHTGWTRAHAFFLIMGGFMLHERGKPDRVLEAEELERLSEAGKIDWPTITEEEIADRSKGDYLSKTIVIFQTTWFIGQCIARGAYGLAVTELEVVTIAFASLTGIIYYFWWDKPLDVRCSIPVHILDTGSPIISPSNISDQELTEGDDNTVFHLDPFTSTPVHVNTSLPVPPLTITVSHIIRLPEHSHQGTLRGDEMMVVHSNPLPTSSTRSLTLVDTSTLGPGLTRMQRFHAFRRRSCIEHGTLFGLVHVFIVFPLTPFFRSFKDMGFCDTLGDKTLRVPTFYSPPHRCGVDNTLFIFAAGVSIIFGAIHCIAWSFYFPTLRERLVWRISAILVSGLPVSLTISVFLWMVFEDEENETTWIKFYSNFMKLIMGPMTCSYIIARIVLLVLPFAALHALPATAYKEIDWVSFLPHI